MSCGVGSVTVAMLLKNTVDKAGQAVESVRVSFDVWWWCCGIGHMTATMPLRNTEPSPSSGAVCRGKV